MRMSDTEANSLFDITRPAAPLTIMSNGSGQDSWAMLVRLAEDPAARAAIAPGQLWCVGSDTGNEHPETYDHVEIIRAYAEAKAVPFKFIKPEDGHHMDSWQTLEGQWERNDTVGSCRGFKRSCTANLKIVPVYNYVNAELARLYGYDAFQKRALREYVRVHGKITVLIGFTADELKRVSDGESDPQWMKDCIIKRYPLIEWGWTRKDCQDYLRSMDQPIPFPSQCLMCHFKSALDLVWTARFYPVQTARWIEREQAKVTRFATREGKNYGVFGIKLIPEVLADALKVYGHLSDDELRAHRMNHGHAIVNSY